jgi:signal transduction histidine kinase
VSATAAECCITHSTVMQTPSRLPSLVLLLLCGWMLITLPAHSADRVVDARLVNATPVTLSPYFDVLEDPSLNLTLPDVQSAAMLPRFEADAPHAQALHFGYTRSAYWLRLQLKNSGDQPLQRLLELRYPGLSSIQFHAPDADGNDRSTTTGSLAPFSSRPYANRFFVFPVTLAPHAQQTVYLRVQSTGPISVPAFLWEPAAFQAHERADYMEQAWYFGIATAMLLFNLLLFLALRDVVYLLYVAFVACMTLTLAAQTGLAKEFLWTDSPWWSNMAVNTGYGLSLATLLLFMRHLLNTPKAIPHSDRVLCPLIGVYLVAPIGFAFALPQLIQPAALLYGATGVLVLAVGTWCAVKRQRSAYFFMAAFAILCLAAIASVFRAMGWLPTNALTTNALQLGSGLEMLVLALALADRFNEMRREKVQAQREVVQAQQRLVQTLQESERVLEERVQHRTAELDRKNQDLTAAISSLETVERIARHDLKTPLGSLAAAPALLRASRTVSAEEESILRMMEVAANRAIQMVNLSLDLLHMENGNYVPSPVCVDLGALTQSVAHDLSAQAQSKAVTVEVTGQNSQALVCAEESLCYSVIANLLKNAVEAAPGGSVVRAALEQGDQMVLRIHNQGAVPEALRANFFSKYATAGKLGGSGLGTYSSRLITTAQGGTLDMQTSDTDGTTLALTLPRWTPVAAPVQATAPGQLTAQRVLVVDDDDFNRMVLVSQLAQQPWVVDSAINGLDALEMVQRHRPDLIVMDIEMPIVGGLAALRLIRAFQAAAGQIPSVIAAYSGHDDAHSHAAYRSQGFDHCFKKVGAAPQLLALLAVPG